MSSYFDRMLPVAKYVSQKTGVYPSVLLAQMYHETGGGTSKGAKTRNNHAGLSWFKPILPSWSKAIKLDNRPVNEGGQYMNYANEWDFAEDYASYLKNGYYDKVLKAGSVEGQVKALGESPWAGTHYLGNGKYNYQGGNIQKLIDQYDLKKYDELEITSPSLNLAKEEVFQLDTKSGAMLLVVGASAVAILSLLSD